jgi:hypothetical protein
MSKVEISDAFTTVIGVILGVAIVSIFIVPIGLAILALDAWVGTYLWGWFVVPIFKLPILSVPAAMGIIITWRLFRGQIDTYSKPTEDQTPAEKKQASGKLFTMLLSPLCVLGLGWLIQHFWMIK